MPTADHIELAPSVPWLADAIESWQANQVFGQHVLMTGSVTALEFLQREGVTPANVERMLADLRAALAVVEREARRRAIPLATTRRDSDA